MVLVQSKNKKKIDFHLLFPKNTATTLQTFFLLSNLLNEINPLIEAVKHLSRVSTW